MRLIVAFINTAGNTPQGSFFYLGTIDEGNKRLDKKNCGWVENFLQLFRIIQLLKINILKLLSSQEAAESILCLNIFCNGDVILT